MLIVPVLTKSDKKKIPYICCTIIAVNCLVFFLLQSQDSFLYENAYSYYEESGLGTIELNAYKNYLAQKGDPAVEEDLQDGTLFQMMFTDEQFLEELEDNRVITPKDPIFEEWQQKRTKFDSMLHQISTYKYGYSPRENNLTGLLTCIFFHGGFMHLLGNMVFLYLVGAILEAAIGPYFFLVLYMVTGVCASALFGIVYPDTPGPLVGASGAIAGLMGAYGVIFGLRKIRVFYSLGFYFNYAMVPALALFPVWLVNEFLQLYFNEGSNVAYVAHIGGLLSGVAIGAGYKPLLADRIDSLFAKAEQKQTVESLLNEGNDLLINFDLAGARRKFEKVLTIRPDSMQAIRHLYVIDKSSPETDRFHRSAEKLLKRIGNNSSDEYLEVFEDYKAAVKKMRLSVDMLEHLCFLYLGKKEFVKAAPLISILLKRAPKSTNLPGYLQQLAVGLQRINKPKEAQKCFQVLAQRYPESTEGVSAVAALNRLRN